MATMSKSRHSRFPSRKSSNSTLILFMLVMFTFVILILFTLGIFSIPSTSSDHDMHKGNDLTSIVRNAIESGGEDEGRREQWLEVLSWEPRAVVYHNLLTKEECEYLIDLAKPHMEKSTVVDSATGKSKDSRVCTSSGTFLPRGFDDVVRNIEKKIADFSFVPVDITMSRAWGRSSNSPL